VLLASQLRKNQCWGCSDDDVEDVPDLEQVEGTRDVAILVEPRNCIWTRRLADLAPTQAALSLLALAT
jgi:hypothetical protein